MLVEGKLFVRNGVARLKRLTENTFNVAGAFDTPSSWSLGRVPATGENVVIAANVTTITGTYTVGNLTINSGITLTFGTTARTLTVNYDLKAANATINMSSATHTLILNGSSNELGTLTTNTSNSTVSYNFVTNTSPFVVRSKTIFASQNYRNLTISVSSTLGSVDPFCTATGNIRVNNNFTCGSANVNMNNYRLEVIGTFTHTNVWGTTTTRTFSNFAASSYFTNISLAQGINNKTVATFTIDSANAVEIRGTITYGDGFCSIGLGSTTTVILSTVNKTIRTRTGGTSTWFAMVINGVTITKDTTNSTTLAITNLSGTSGILNGNGQTTVTNNLGGVTYNP